MQKAIRINGGYAVIEYYQAAQPTVTTGGVPRKFEKYFVVDKLTLYAKDLNTGNTVPIRIEPLQLQEIAGALNELEAGRHEITEDEFIEFQS